MRRVRSALVRYGWVEAQGKEEWLEVLAARAAGVKSGSSVANETHDLTQPLVLRKCAEQWRKTWSRDSFIDRFGHQDFKLRSCLDLHECSFTGPWRFAPLREYFDRDDGDASIIFENSFLPPPLHQALWSGGQWPEVLSHIHAEPVLNLGRRHSFIAFHGGSSAIWMAQLVGRSAWFLAPPGRRPETREPWSYVPETEVPSVIVEPGDVIYVPENWWRSFWNLEDFNLGLGWESPDDGSGHWSDAMHAVADGDLQKLKLSEVTEAPSQEMLYLAARAGNEDVLAYLLQRADCAEDRWNFGAISAGAAISGHRSALALLQPYAQRHGTWHSWAVHGAVSTNSLAALGAPLLPAEANADDAFNDAWAPEHFLQEGIPLTPLHLAAWNGHGAAVEELLRCGAKVNFLGQDLKRVPMWRPAMDGSAGSSPLHLAALRGHAEVMHHLLDAAGALVDARDAAEATALHRAAQGGHVQVLQQLLSAGADVALRAGQERWTSWEVAEAHGFPEVSDFLKRQPRPK